MWLSVGFKYLSIVVFVPSQSTDEASGGLGDLFLQRINLRRGMTRLWGECGECGEFEVRRRDRTRSSLKL